MEYAVIFQGKKLDPKYKLSWSFQFQFFNKWINMDKGSMCESVYVHQADGRIKHKQK